MPTGLLRFHHTGDWHCTCYRREKFLDSVRRRDILLDILEQVRAKYEFVVAGYVLPGVPNAPAFGELGWSDAGRAA